MNSTFGRQGSNWTWSCLNWYMGFEKLGTNSCLKMMWSLGEKIPWFECGHAKFLGLESSWRRETYQARGKKVNDGEDSGGNFNSGRLGP